MNQSMTALGGLGQTLGGLGGTLLNMPGLAQKLQRAQAQKAQMGMTMGQSGMMGMGPLGMSMMGGGGVAPFPMPQIPGMPPVAWSPLLQGAVQIPRELAQDSQQSTCALYAQVVELAEELENERKLRKSLAEDVEVFSTKYDRLLAEQEVLYKDFFRQRANWDAEKKMLDDRLRVNGDLLTDTRRKCLDQETQNGTLQQMVRQNAPGQAEGEWKTRLLDAMSRIASLEQNESVLSRKCDSAQQDHAVVKQAFDNLEKDLTERESFLKERLLKAVLWKKRTANALRIARKRLSAMVPGTNFERVQQELAVSKRRELDLARRQNELTLANAQKEDRLRGMVDLQERSANLDEHLRETEQEYTVMRRRLQAHEPQFAAECALFARLASEVQRALGLVGQWDPVPRALAAEVTIGAKEDADAVRIKSVETLFDERLRQLDTNNDGFVTLGDVVHNFENLGLKVSDVEVTQLAEALHVVAPIQSVAAVPPVAYPAYGTSPAGFAPASGTAPGQYPSPPGTTAALDAVTLKKASVSVLAVVGRLRLFGLRPLEPEDLFWTAVQAAMMRRQLDSQNMLKTGTGFQVLNVQGYISVLDVLRVLGNIDIQAERLPTPGLRRVLSWLGVEARDLDKEAPLETLPKMGDPLDADVRGRLAKLRLVYHDFSERFEKSCARALQILIPPESSLLAQGQMMPASKPGTDHALKVYMAEAREAAANRRCVVLEQEVRTKVRTVKELQRQVGELESLSQRVEGELHEERAKGVDVSSRLDSTLLSLNIKNMSEVAQVETKLKKLEELGFQVQQSHFALQQEKDLRRVCATQAENYEKLVKRRQQEVRHLQETVKMMQCKDEVSNTVGKIQYRLLLSQWEKSNTQRQLQAATGELRAARTQLLENEEELDKEKHCWAEEEESLHAKLVDAREMSEKYKEQATGSMPIDKARELTAKVDQIAASKTAVEEKFMAARRELHRNETERAELKLRAEQAKMLADELSTFEEGSDAPRTRLLDMAKKLESSKLLELRHKRELELEKEQLTQMHESRKADAKEILDLQQECAKAEATLVATEEQWREKILNVQQTMMQGGAIPVGAPGGGAGRRMSFKGMSKDQLTGLEQLSERLNEKDIKINELEALMEKASADQQTAVAEAGMKVRKLELELNLMTGSDTVKLRQVLRAEHEEEMQQISRAAHESVTTLQALIDQAEARIAERDGKVHELLVAKREIAENHMKETMELQNNISTLRKELIAVRHSPDAGSMGMTPHAGTGLGIDFNASLEQSISNLDMFPGGMDGHLEERRQQLMMLEEQLTSQNGEWRGALQQHQEDALRKEQSLFEEFRAREVQMQEAVKAREYELRQRCAAMEEELNRSRANADHGSAMTGQQQQELQQQVLLHHGLAQQHGQSLEQQKQQYEVAQVFDNDHSLNF